MALNPLSPARQIVFHQMLVAFRKTILMDALSDALAQVDPKIIKKQLLKYVPADAQRILAASGVRDEHVFPVPAILEQRPNLVGYYRLLLGVSQKRFYRSGTGMSPYRSMEVRGILNIKRPPDLHSFCSVMAGNLAELVRSASPSITAREVSELPLLTLGGQLYGSDNNAIGKQVTREVFGAVADVVSQFTTSQSGSKIILRNASKRKVIITLGADPDIRLQEEFEGTFRNIVAVEIKGGADMSNVHNRVGEAEKSHRKAKKQDFRDCWTMIPLTGLDRA